MCVLLAGFLHPRQFLSLQAHPASAERAAPRGRLHAGPLPDAGRKGRGPAAPAGPQAQRILQSEPLQALHAGRLSLRRRLPLRPRGAGAQEVSPRRGTGGDGPPGLRGALGKYVRGRGGRGRQPRVLSGRGGGGRPARARAGGREGGLLLHRPGGHPARPGPERRRGGVVRAVEARQRDTGEKKTEPKRNNHALLHRVQLGPHTGGRAGHLPPGLRRAAGPKVSRRISVRAAGRVVSDRRASHHTGGGGGAGPAAAHAGDAAVSGHDQDHGHGAPEGHVGISSGHALRAFRGGGGRRSVPARSDQARVAHCAGARVYFWL
mmetsp:Transcript_35039/g.81035  ORF Transcript_35039/g.81035 Transcript_35039/m.81035 type:complete len:320 (-) Transcript_35039:699-1658(-)